MEWNKEKEHPIPKSESELNKIAAMTFNGLNCPNLAQADKLNQPHIDTEDLSISSFNTSHLPGGKVAAEDNSLATAQAYVAGTVKDEADLALATTAAQVAKTLVPVDVDTDDLASMKDSIHNSCNSSSSSSSSSLKDHPNSASTAPPEDMEMEPHDEESNPIAVFAAIPDSSNVQLQSVGDHHCRQTQHWWWNYWWAMQVVQGQESPTGMGTSSIPATVFLGLENIFRRRVISVMAKRSSGNE